MQDFARRLTQKCDTKWLFLRENRLTNSLHGYIIPHVHAGMAELADALDSGSSESNFMQVQVLFPAPYKNAPALAGAFLYPSTGNWA